MSSIDTRTAAELEQAVIEGDEKISAEQIHAAGLRERIAALREKAAEKRAAQQAEKERLAAIAELKAEILAMSCGTAADLAQAVADAIQAFRDECESHNARLHGWRVRAVTLGVLVGWDAGGGLRVGGREISQLHCDSVLKRCQDGRHADFSAALPGWARLGDTP